MRVVAYARVSTDSQATEGWSLSAQERRIKLYCESRGWTLERLFVDAGISSRAKRPAFDEMISYVSSHVISHVVVLKLDRLHRSVKDTLALYDYLADHNVSIASIDEGFDSSTAMGRFVRTILAGVAELERDMASERTKVALAEARKRGVRLGRPPKVPANGSTALSEPSEAILRP